MRRGPETSIAPAVDAFAKRFEKQAQASGGIEAALAELLPPGLRSRVRVVRVTPGGVVVLQADDSTSGYEVDVWQRSGGLAQARSACKIKILRFKIETR